MKRNHSPHKPRQLQRKPTVNDVIDQAREMIREATGGLMHVSIIVRHPTNRDAEIWNGDDDPDQLMGMLLRRRMQYDASREAGKAIVAPSEDPT